MYSKHREELLNFFDIVGKLKFEKVVCSISAPYDIETQFSSPWPNNTLPGVYLFFSNSFDLLYLGESNYIGRRLNNYFNYSTDNNNCGVPIKPESMNTRYIITIGLNNNYGWLSQSLEKYLIQELKPERNRIGNY